MKIGIIGTRGIPNRYGGFEQFAEYLAEGLCAKGFEVSVYCPDNHPLKELSWNNINRIIKPNPEQFIGAAAQFIYDFLCILDSRKREFDIILQLGYTSSAIWGWMLPKNSIIVTNMDGIEYARTKYNSLIKRFLRHSEYLAVRRSKVLVADSPVIAEHLLKKYQTHSIYIPYGADVFTNADPSYLEEFGLLPFQYFLVIARMQPDNHIETILEAHTISNIGIPILLIGDTANSYGRYLKKRYPNPDIIWGGSVFDQSKLNNLRHFCTRYLHGHSAGGTNPSLLEAMASGAPVFAHDNAFNRSVLGLDAMYFSDVISLSEILIRKVDMAERQQSIQNNKEKIERHYTKAAIVEAYKDLFQQAIQNRA